MSAPTCTLLVLKTRQLEQLREFYSHLGISFIQEQHGNGPTHYAGRVGDLVLELYPLPPEVGPADNTTRLGFAVADVEDIGRLMEASGYKVDSRLKVTAWGRRAVVRDPDGRAVELSGPPLSS